jgi:Mn2+/Fe2+ NRAMP family transporter
MGTELAKDSSGIKTPPQSFLSIFRFLGPGMIIAGSIVGSGELIATTKVGAEAGFTLLWLIIIGCVIKVFTQIEFGRYTITFNQTPLKALDTIPGPRLKVNWIVWYWVILNFLVLTQQGGIVGGVGQAMTISYPLTNQGKTYNDLQDQLVEAKVQIAILQQQNPKSSQLTLLTQKINTLTKQIQNLSEPKDSYLWATIIAVLTSVMLFIGRYGFIQAATTFLVITFTFVTVITLFLLQTTPWAVSSRELFSGLSFKLPEASEILGKNPVSTALAAFGIIGMGAVELVMYPYWCMEKGYAKFTGIRNSTSAWIKRARGWMRVLYVDAWVSMFVYTFATVAFFLLGAAVLGRTGLNPAGRDMIRFLAEMYVPVFGSWAQVVFLFGAFAVLYSTFFVVSAGNARIIADALILYGLIGDTDESRLKWTKILSIGWPMCAMAMYWLVGWLFKGQSPAVMILASGTGQAIMLPMLGFAALYFCFKRSDKKMQPKLVWKIFLFISCLGFLTIGIWILYDTFL